ncbi:hypothetical protein CA13_41360 [Planctomycetes bacterium CA13]|uniref:Uncharacterized protein n=1 Tax=Novipirellula herctigrandis TaxID=2527986 RepID=A0A5C5Z830_9BACT|nr:hypothetical protein CA13_41360 [Planctomycetes bacterium CA13]
MTVAFPRIYKEASGAPKVTCVLNCRDQNLRRPNKMTDRVVVARPKGERMIWVSMQIVSMALGSRAGLKNRQKVPQNVTS